MKKIVCTTDFTTNSVAALRYAYELSKLLDKDLLVLNICNPKNDEEYHSASDTKAILHNQQNILEEFCSVNLNDSFQNLNITAAIRKGKNIPKKINNFIRDLDILFLVIGTHGSSSFNPMSFGSITNKMIESSPFPILAIPPAFKFKKPETIVYTSDFEEEDIYNLKELVKIFQPLKTRIIILHIYAHKEYLTKERLIGFQTLLAEKVAIDHFNFEMIFSENVLKTLQTFLISSNADMVAMLERKNKSEFKNIFHNDLVKKMDNSTQIPLLSFNTIY